MKNHLFNLSKAICTASVMVCLLTGPAQAVLVNLANTDFHLPMVGKISHGYDLSSTNVDVPYWNNSGTIYNDTGLETSPPGPPPFGGYAAYTRSGDSGAYQIATNTMVPGTTYVLTFWAARGGGSAQTGGTCTNQVSLISAPATNTPFSGTTVLVATNTTS
ncbi:MAG TPA: hypothetical protein VMA13_06025, partial [Candidatus Saccharimonadales bacterium]|nr:hypothetical protein [Candidatus Saccharimonadales bacterium]